MKKIPIEKENYLIKHSIEVGEHSFSRSRKRKNQLKLKLKERILRRRNSKFRTVLPPNDFSFINGISNVENQIRYYEKYGELFKEGYAGYFDLRKSTGLSFDALSLLMVKLNDKSYINRRSTKGKFPQDDESLKLVQESGFLKHVDRPIDTITNMAGNMHWHHTQKKYDVKMASEVAHLIVDHSFSKASEDEKLQKVQRIYPLLIECMLNTQVWAGEDYNWRLTYYREADGVTKVCFIDVGQGILSTLNAKINNLTLKSRLFLLFNDKSSLVLKSLVKGDIIHLDKKTSTEKNERGKGLPSMGIFSRLDFVNKFVIISNNVYADIKNHNYSELNETFGGTFIYREIKE